MLVVPQRRLVHNKLHCWEDIRWRGKTLLDITKLFLDSNKGDCFLKSDLLIIPYLLIFRDTYPPHLESVRPLRLVRHPCSNSSRSFLEADMCVAHGRGQRCTRPRTTYHVPCHNGQRAARHGHKARPFPPTLRLTHYLYRTASYLRCTHHGHRRRCTP